MGPMGERQVGGRCDGRRWWWGVGGGSSLRITIRCLYFFRPLKMTSLGLQKQAACNGVNSNQCTCWGCMVLSPLAPFLPPSLPLAAIGGPADCPSSLLSITVYSYLNAALSFISVANGFLSLTSTEAFKIRWWDGQGYAKGQCTVPTIKKD